MLAPANVWGRPGRAGAGGGAMGGNRARRAQMGTFLCEGNGTW